MKIMDRLLGLDPELALTGNPNYDFYRSGLKWTAVGLAAVAGGLVLDAVSVKEGIDVAAGGASVMWLGGAAAALSTDHLH
jgi:hypothetical protein